MSARPLCRLLLAVTIVLASLGIARRASAVALPLGFTYDVVTPSAPFDNPTDLAFLPDGRMLVSEKAGLLWAVTNGVRAPSPLWDGRMQVLDEHDRGFLSIAVDPHYTTNHFVYLMYVVDPDSNGVDTEPEAYDRLERWTISFTDSTQFVPNSRVVLFGSQWSNGALVAQPSHSVGCLRFGRDGTLLVSIGDGASFDYADPGGLNPNAFLPGRTDPSEDIGAYRSQDINSMCGKVLRLDPATGHGLPSNPYYDGNPLSVRSRVWAYGLRNPFRFTIRPGTGSTDPAQGKPGQLFIGDVGWYTYEEVNVSNRGGENFGWPCFEGVQPTDQYDFLPPSETTMCNLGTATNPATVWTNAIFVTHHTTPGLSIPTGYIGNCSLGGTFYTGTQYPPAFQNKYFAMDYGQGWFKAFDTDSTGLLNSITDFSEGMDSPVDMETDPFTGDIVYISITTGEIRRIRWAGGSGPGNQPPVVKLQGTPDVGVAPLNVSFSSLGTFDPNGDTIAYSWDFGDGNGSPLPNPTHLYPIPGEYRVTLTCDDHNGGITSDTMHVSVAISADFPTTGVLDDFNRADGPVGGNWVGDVSGMQVINGQLQQTTLSSSMVLSTPTLGPTQEAYMTIVRMTPGAPEHNLMLKVQGLSWDTGHIEVRYDGTQNGVWVSTYSPFQGWVGRAPMIPCTMQDHDQFGARAYPNGIVVVYKNGVQLGSVDCSGWDFATQGGHVGMTLTGASASLIDNFGGGNAVLNVNTPPAVQILRADTTFAVTGDTLNFACTVHDNQQADSTLGFRWDIDIHHNNHVHPSVATSTTPTLQYVMINHDDGTGVFFLVKLRVTDAGNLTTADTVRVFPQIDLTPSPIQITPANPTNANRVTLSFRDRNLGGMPAHIHHWTLLLDGAVAAQGDTVVAARDSVLLAFVSPAPLAVGHHSAHVVVDSVATITNDFSENVETNETNNDTTLDFDVTATAGVDGGLPRTLALSNAWPNPAVGRASFTLDLPRNSGVSMSVHDLQGRVVWSSGLHAYNAGRWSLPWPGTIAGGGRAAAGMYLVRVEAGGKSFTRRLVLLQ